MDNMERQLTRIENNIAAVRPSTAIQRGAATRIQRAVRGAQAKKEYRNRILNEASRENQMQAAANRFNAIGEQMLNRTERQANIYGGEFVQGSARSRMKRARTTVSNLDTRTYANPREAPEITRQRANQTIQRMRTSRKTSYKIRTTTNRRDTVNTIYGFNNYGCSIYTKEKIKIELN